MQNQINLLLMLARLCFDNLLLIDERLDDNPEKKNMKSLQQREKKT
jgi:hypothetical protein